MLGYQSLAGPEYYSVVMEARSEKRDDVRTTCPAITSCSCEGEVLPAKFCTHREVRSANSLNRFPPKAF